MEVNALIVVAAGVVFVTYCLLWLTFLRSLFTIASALDNLLAPSFGKKVEEWAQDLTGKKNSWPGAVLSSFDSLFSSDLWSFKALLRSGFFALSATFLAFIIWLLLGTNTDGLVLLTTAPTRLASTVIIVTAVTAWLPFHIAVFETRLLVKIFLSKSSRRFRIEILLAVIALDLILTIIIASLIPWPLAMFSGPGANITHFWPDLIQPTHHMHDLYFIERKERILVRFTEDHAKESYAPVDDILLARLPLSIWYYSVFFTSIWVWILAITRIVPPLKDLVAKLPWGEHPFGSAGLLAAFVITAMFVLGSLFLPGKILNVYEQTMEKTTNETNLS